MKAKNCIDQWKQERKKKLKGKQMNKTILKKIHSKQNERIQTTIENVRKIIQKKQPVAKRSAVPQLGSGRKGVNVW